jgi:quercetin dioxygenase-like cupin family protein
VNGDGKADLVWHHTTTGQVTVWLMNGAQILQAGEVAQVGDLGWQIARVIDVNGDGKADLVWHHTTTGQVTVWLMNGAQILQAGEVAQVGDLGWQLQ